MTDLATKHCKPCEGGVSPMDYKTAAEELKKIDNWQMNDAGTELTKQFEFKNFYQTMAFVNALAYMANLENHHPDLKVGYNYCHVVYSTHAINGLSINDFICAAKVDTLRSL